MKMLRMHFFKIVTVVISSFFLIFQPSNAARILAMVPTPSYSHQNAFYPLWTELSLRGHDVTLITTDPINNSSLTNLTEIDLHDLAYEVLNKKIKGVLESGSISTYTLLDLITFGAIIEAANQELGHPKVKAIINNETEHFDLFMVEASTPIVYAFAKRFKCPFIVIVSYDGISNYYKLIGNPSHPITNPNIFSAYNEVLNFKERITSVTIELLYIALEYCYREYSNSIVKNHFGLEYTEILAFGNNVSMLFVNSNPIFSRVRPLAPNVIQFGGGTHMKPLQPLPEELQNFLDGANEGFIYFSLGSNIKSKDLLPETAKTLMETFSALPYRVLWKFEENRLSNLPNHVMIFKWLPQQDVLRHRNIKLFITQGGLQSLEESLHCHVPIVGLPFFADQFANVKRAVDKGMGLSADPFSLNKENFKKIIMDVISDPKYRTRVKQLSDLIHDQPMTGLQRVIWWTEYVIRHKGATHLRSPALDIPFYQYYLLDIIVFYMTVVLILIYIVFKVLQLLYRIYRFIFKKNLKIKSE